MISVAKIFFVFHRSKAKTGNATMYMLAVAKVTGLPMNQKCPAKKSSAVRRAAKRGVILFSNAVCRNPKVSMSWKNVVATIHGAHIQPTIPKFVLTSAITNAIKTGI